MSALKLLNEYISDLNSTGELSEQNIKDSKYEQKKILKELTYIQNSLNSLIEKDSEFY
jgi:formiminotetrahydrofolate cyclodeaminase